MDIVKNILVTWDTAYEARLSGFDEPTQYYLIHGHDGGIEQEKTSDRFINWNGIPHTKGKDKYYSQPTLMQVKNWLQRVHNLEVIPLTLAEAPESWLEYVSTNEHVFDWQLHDALQEIR